MLHVWMGTCGCAVHALEKGICMRVESARMHVVSVDGVIISAQAKGLATVLRVRAHAAHVDGDVCCTGKGSLRACCTWMGTAAVLHRQRVSACVLHVWMGRAGILHE